jgi:hypothetical protein
MPTLLGLVLADRVFGILWSRECEGGKISDVSALSQLSQCHTFGYAPDSRS